MLRHYLTTYLIVTGIGGFIAITCPILVILGSIAIFPGLALALMPTAFLWGLFFAVIWQAAIRFVGEWPAAAVAFSLTMALLTYLPKVLNAPTARQAAEARTGDLLPESRIELKGIIEVQTESYGMEQGETAVGRAYGEAWPTSVKKGAAQWDDAPLICDERCMHLVFKPGVEGVIVRPMRVKNKILLPVTLFRISPAARDESLASPIGSGPLQAAWKLRISQGERVERTKPGERKPDFILSFATQGFHDRGKWSDWSFGPTPLQTERVTISTGDGRVLLRQTSGTTRLLSAPLNVWPQISMENASFGWARGG